jgi:hypothetical protein
MSDYAHPDPLAHQALEAQRREARREARWAASAARRRRARLTGWAAGLLFLAGLGAVLALGSRAGQPRDLGEAAVALAALGARLEAADETAARAGYDLSASLGPAWTMGAAGAVHAIETGFSVADLGLARRGLRDLERHVEAAEDRARRLR